MATTIFSTGELLQPQSRKQLEHRLGVLPYWLVCAPNSISGAGLTYEYKFPVCLQIPSLAANSQLGCQFWLSILAANSQSDPNHVIIFLKASLSE